MVSVGQVNNMPRFIGTPAFNLCALILGRPHFRLKPQNGGNAASIITSTLGASHIGIHDEESCDRVGSTNRPRFAATAVAGGAAGTPTNGGRPRTAMPSGVDMTTMHVPKERPSTLAQAVDDQNPHRRDRGSPVHVANDRRPLLLPGSDSNGTMVSPGGVHTNSPTAQMRAVGSPSPVLQATISTSPLPPTGPTLAHVVTRPDALR
jgi:hypothetical protein